MAPRTMASLSWDDLEYVNHLFVPVSLVREDKAL